MTRRPEAFLAQNSTYAPYMRKRAALQGNLCHRDVPDASQLPDQSKPNCKCTVYELVQSSLSAAALLMLKLGCRC
jgi:hypothetical protein